MRRGNAAILILATGLAAAPASLGAEPKEKVWRVGILAAGSSGGVSGNEPIDEFPAGLRDLGYVEGRNLVVVRRSAEGNYGRLPQLAVAA